jgi:site-specific DNA-methyltransferase (adenine-specific)
MRTPLKRFGFHHIPETKDYTETKTGKIYQKDAVELVGSLPDDSIDLVCFDPAYESLEKWRELGTTTRLKQSKGSSNKWFELFPNLRYFDLFAQFFRVLKPGSHLYMFCDEETRDLVCTGYSPQIDRYIDCRDQRTMAHGSGPLILAGFKYWKSIIWDKEHAGMGYHYRAQHELIVFAEKVERKGKHRRLNDPKPGDVLKYTRLKGKSFYPTEKPLELVKVLVGQSTNPGDTVLDPFCGSGVVGQACEALGRNYILGDIDPEEAIRRLK